MSNEDTDEARRLIEEAFGGADRIAALIDRADGSTDAFVKAAEAFGRDELFSSAAALEGYVLASSEPGKAVYDLCAAGAFVVAGLVVATPTPCGHDDCRGATRIDPDSADDMWTRIAVHCVNAAADQRPDLLAETLNMVYSADGHEGLRHVAAMLVNAHRGVSTSRGDS